MVYLRQSTMVQVREHTESTARQYGLAAEAARLGWAAAAGRGRRRRPGRLGPVRRRPRTGSGSSWPGSAWARSARCSAWRSPGWRAPSAEFARLLELARLTDTLVIDADGVYDLADINDRLLLGLKGSMSEAELHLLTAGCTGRNAPPRRRGELRHAAAGRLSTTTTARSCIDPDEQVAAAVADVFAEFAATGSAYGVVGGVRRTAAFPLRAYGGVWAGQLRWGRLTHGRVLQCAEQPRLRRGLRLRPAPHPAHACSPTAACAPRSGRCPASSGRADPRPPRRLHHLGRSTWTSRPSWRPTAPTPVPAHPGRAPPLCQGIISCGLCGRRVGTRYQGQRRRAFYDCMGHRDAAPHQRLPVDRRRRRSTTRWPTLLLAARDPGADPAGAGRGRRGHRPPRPRATAPPNWPCERARYEADRAERAFNQVEPDNRLVARTLEARWEAKLAALAEAETALAAARQSRAAAARTRRLQALAADLPRLWR